VAPRRGYDWEDAGNIAASFLAWFLGCLFVYATLFATGYLLYGRLAIGLVCAAVAIAAAFGLWRAIPRWASGRLEPAL
jgi:hypothetical protein